MYDGVLNKIISIWENLMGKKLSTSMRFRLKGMSEYLYFF